MVVLNATFDIVFLVMSGEISFHDICAARYWNHGKTVGLWAWRNQNVTKTLGFYGGFKRNVWHQRWAKGGLKMVFVSRPGHAVSLFWGFFFQGARGLPCPQFPQVLQNHHYHIKTLSADPCLQGGARPEKGFGTTTITATTTTTTKTTTTTTTTTTAICLPSHAVLLLRKCHFWMVFLMLRGEICLSMVSQRQGTGVMSKLSVYGCEETKTWPKP